MPPRVPGLRSRVRQPLLSPVGNGSVRQSRPGTILLAQHALTGRSGQVDAPVGWHLACNSCNVGRQRLALQRAPAGRQHVLDATNGRRAPRVRMAQASAASAGLAGLPLFAELNHGLHSSPRHGASSRFRSTRGWSPRLFATLRYVYTFLPLSRRRNTQKRLKFPVRTVRNGTGVPLRRVGSNRHCARALTNDLAKAG